MRGSAAALLGILSLVERLHVPGTTIGSMRRIPQGLLYAKSWRRIPVQLAMARQFFLAAFLFCQCWFNAFVTFASHVRSCTCSSSSEAAKNFTLYGDGLPSGLSRRAPTRIGTSCG